MAQTDSSGDHALDPLDDLLEETPEPAPSKPERAAPPPRLNGKTFNTAIIDDAGRTRRIEIRMREGAAETRVDGQIVPADRVLVHRRGFVEIVDAEGARELSFNLPRGMTSVTRATR